MDLFNLISAPNPAKVKTETRPRTALEVLLLTVTASRVIDMEDTAVASGSSGTHSALEKSPLDFANEDPPQMITEMGLEKEVAAMGPPVNKRRRKRGNDEAEANAQPKENGPRDPHRKCCYHGGARSVLHGEFKVREINILPICVRVAKGYLSAGVRRDQQLPPGHPRRMPRHGRSHSTTGELRHLPNTDFLSQYNMNLARQVAMGSQL
ncbi:hypothetical protein Tco_0049282, partial [Tanacetum coccineum]